MNGGIFHVYLLIDMVEGIFYVGCGKDNRLSTTLSESKNIHNVSRKALKIRAIHALGRKVVQEVVYSSNDPIAARRVEAFLIQVYCDCLTNYEGVHTLYPQYIYTETLRPDCEEIPALIRDVSSHEQKKRVRPPTYR